MSGMAALFFHQTTRFVELTGAPDDLWPAVHACIERLGRVALSTPEQRSLLVKVRRRLGRVDVGVHVQAGGRPGVVAVEVVAMGGGFTDAAVTSAAELVADRLRREVSTR